LKKFLILVFLIFSYSSVSHAGGFDIDQSWAIPLIIIAIVSGLIIFLTEAFLLRKRDINADDAWEAFGAWFELLTTLPVIFISRCVLAISLFMLWSIFFEEVLIAVIVILIIIFALYKILDKNKK
tara:strand:- start:13 stop:387 length:375 start_codon:yes stop_codon:yes gene_type:complete